MAYQCPECGEYAFDGKRCDACSHKTSDYDFSSPYYHNPADQCPECGTRNSTGELFDERYRNISAKSSKPYNEDGNATFRKGDINYFTKPDKLYSLINLKKSPPPRKSGVYGWYFDDPPPYVPTTGCTFVTTGWWPFRTKWRLLYIGKAKNLKYRVYEMHFNNKFWMNKSLSSLRLTLGCLLCKEKNLYLGKHLGLQKDYTFGRKGDIKLSRWMDKHARVTWVETTEYVELEKQTISRYVLPLNTKDNPKPFAPLKNLRGKFKTIASSQKPKKKDFRAVYKEFVKECKRLGIEK